MSARGVGVLLGTIAAAGLLAGCEHAAATPPPGGGGMPPALVTTAPVGSAALPVYLDAIGRCTAFELVAVQPQVTGAITGIHFKDGADVNVGDVLFTIDERPYKAQLELAQGQLAQNKAQLALGRTEADRMETLLRTNAVSRQERDARQGAVEVAEAQVQSSLAAVAAAKINVEFCTIRSPIKGRLGQRLVDLGNVVTANNSTTLVTIQRQDPIYADFTVSERDLAAVRHALATGALTAHVRVPGPDGADREGPITFLDNAVQDATGTVKLRAQLDNKDRAFWPGQFVEVRLILALRSGALVVPATAIQIGQQGTFVYVVKADSTVELRPVTTGQRHGDRVIVETGLKLDEPVVVRGQLMLMPGAKVEIAKPEKAAPAAQEPAK